MSYVADLDARLLKLSESDYFTLRDAFAGVHVFGGIGSGKTSGSGKAIAGALLRANAGGLVLCAKPDERERWQRYAAAGTFGRAPGFVAPPCRREPAASSLRAGHPAQTRHQPRPTEVSRIISFLPFFCCRP